MDERTYNKIREKISKGMSLREACGYNNSEKTLFLRWRKRRHDEPIVSIKTQQKAEQKADGKVYVPKYKEINQQTLDEIERYFLGSLSDEIQQGNPRVFRLMLDFLKARHPAYKETSRMFTPDDYKKVWEDVNGKAQSSGNE